MNRWSVNVNVKGQLECERAGDDLLFYEIYWVFKKIK